jgi:primosomal protein N' (replication factor Y)
VKTPPTVLQVAVPAPVSGSFDYLPPAGAGGPIQPGQRLRVPFGRSTRIGVVIGSSEGSSLPAARLKPALELLDQEPLLPGDLVRMLLFAARYYQHPVGEVFAAALPAGLRSGQAPAAGARLFRLTAAGCEAAADPTHPLRRAPAQARLLEQLAGALDGLEPDALRELSGDWRRAVKALAARGWLEEGERPALPPAGGNEPAPPLNPAQAEAAAAITGVAGYGCLLLDGVTGSGKTEVYLAAIERMIADGRQSLVLVPEIALTPQLVGRFRRRLAAPVVEMHSGLADGDRLRSWTATRDGSAAVVIGTRSAIFAPLARPGLIIVDEEHDASYKQQEGFRYSARDLAVWRAHELGIPVVLGSATPALESIENCRAGRYRRLVLPARAGGASSPSITLVDLRRQRLEAGLGTALRTAMREHLSGGGQVLLYLNRRGYAPTLLCTDCGWIATCTRCDARYVLHRARHRLVCHHCGAERPAPDQCPDCSAELRTLGMGTEQLEHYLAEQFAEWPVVRIDRDTTRRRGEMARRLEQVRSAEARILVGTQMLTKGHDFPQVTLVGILDADQGLFGTDFRSSERLAQALVQVAGRAGRAERPGQVLVQTAFPQHPLLRTLLASGYAHFAELALLERRETGWPPYTCLCLLRAEAPQREAVTRFLAQAKQAAAALAGAGLDLLGPAPAPMERRSGRYRGQLLARAPGRRELQEFLPGWRDALAALPGQQRVRWTLDVDPVELA